MPEAKKPVSIDAKKLTDEHASYSDIPPIDQYTVRAVKHYSIGIAEREIVGHRIGAHQPLTQKAQDAVNARLLNAAASGEIEGIDHALADGAYIDAVSEKGHTALHLTILKNHFEAFLELLERGADFNIRNARGKTPLHCAVGAGDWDMIKVLLACGASLDIKERHKLTPYDFARTMETHAKKGKATFPSEVYTEIATYLDAISQKKIARPTQQSLAQTMDFDVYRCRSSHGNRTPKAVVDLDGADRQSVLVKPAAQLPLI